MSRTRKKAKTPRKNSRGWTLVCPRHGYCSWCDSDRQHNKLKTEAEVIQDLEDFKKLDHWMDDIVEYND